jgi:hypothetical protein
MVEEDRYCIDVLTQLQAVRAALTRVESEMLKDHLGHCIEAAITAATRPTSARRRRNSSSFWSAAPDDDPVRTRPPRAAARRRCLGVGAGVAGLSRPGLDRDGRSAPVLSGTDIRLRIGHSAFAVGGRSGHAVTVNGTLPRRCCACGRVRTSHSRHNSLDVDSSIHWHGCSSPSRWTECPA